MDIGQPVRTIRVVPANNPVPLREPATVPAEPVQAPQEEPVHEEQER